MTVEQLASVVTNELGFVNMWLTIITIALIAIVGYLVNKLRTQDRTMSKMARELRYIRRYLN